MVCGYTPPFPKSTQPTSTKRPCAGCGRPRALEAEICAGCGLHFATGLRVQQEAALPAAAPAPRHRLPDEPSPPTAKKPKPRDLTREERRQRNIAEYWRHTRLVFILGTIVGVAASFGIGVSARGMDPLLVLINLLGAQAAVFISCYGLGFMYIGFEEDLRGLAMRMVGIASLWTAALLLITMVPPMTILMVVGMALMAVFSLGGLIKALTDREWTDSSVIALGAFALIFIVELVIALVAAGADQA